MIASNLPNTLVAELLTSGVLGGALTRVVDRLLTRGQAKVTQVATLTSSTAQWVTFLDARNQYLERRIGRLERVWSQWARNVHEAVPPSIDLPELPDLDDFERPPQPPPGPPPPIPSLNPAGPALDTPGDTP